MPGAAAVPERLLLLLLLLLHATATAAATGTPPLLRVPVSRARWSPRAAAHRSTSRTPPSRAGARA